MTGGGGGLVPSIYLWEVAIQCNYTTGYGTEDIGIFNAAFH